MCSGPGGTTYLQHEHHSLHDVPLRPPSVHDNSEPPSFTLLTKRGGKIFREKEQPTFTYSFLLMAFSNFSLYSNDVVEFSLSKP